MLSGHPWNLLFLLTIDRQNPCQAQAPAEHPGPNCVGHVCARTHAHTRAHTLYINTHSEWTGQGTDNNSQKGQEGQHRQGTRAGRTGRTRASGVQAVAAPRLCIWLCLSRAPHSLHTAAANPRARTNGTAVCLAPFWKGGRKKGGREMTIGNPALGNLRFSHHLPTVRPAWTPGPPRSSKAQGHPQQVEATSRYPPYKKKSMSPTLGESGFSGSSQERWQ